MVTMQECMEFSVSYFHLPRGMCYYYTLHSGRTIAYIPTCTTRHTYVTMYATIILLFSVANKLLVYTYYASIVHPVVYIY